MVYSFRRGPNGMGQKGSFDGGDSARYASVREVRAYWDALRDDQDLPRREQINPRGMAGALHQVFMVERIAPGIARFRLAGMEINDLLGMEVRGMPLSALFEPAARVRLGELLEKVVNTRTIVELDLEAERGIGRPSLRARLVLLPLKGSAGEPDLILGCLACDGQIGRVPRRFVIARALEVVIEAAPELRGRLHLGRPETGSKTAFVARPMPKLVPELAEPKAPKFEPARPPKHQTHLRLVTPDM